MTFYCQGTVKSNDTILSGVVVNLYLRSTGQLVSAGITTSSGTFCLPSDYDDYHFAVALYVDSTKNALVYDYLSPIDEEE